MGRDEHISDRAPANQAADLSSSSRLNQHAMWFQLANVRVTTLSLSQHAAAGLGLLITSLSFPRELVSLTETGQGGRRLAMNRDDARLAYGDLHAWLTKVK